MTYFKSKTQLNFSNMFAHLRNVQQINNNPANSISTFITKKRPQSMYVPRSKTQQDKKPMRKSFYSISHLTRRENQTNIKTKKYFTEESQPVNKFFPNQNQKGLRFLAINNFCIKKIPMQSHQIDMRTQNDKKIKVNQLQISVPYENPETNYKKKILRSYKKNKIVNYLRKCDISTRIEGHKIF